MQHTTKYNFNLIETSDAFGPEALNQNAQQLEDALITHETEVDSALKSQKLEWQAADDALKAADTALSQTVAAQKTELQAADTAVRAEFAAADAAQKSELQASITSLQTALGSGGSNCRIQTGSYKGNGKCGSSANANSLTFGFQPWLVIIGCNQIPSNASATGVRSCYDSWPSILVRGATVGHSDRANYVFTVTWSAKAVSWYCASTDPSHQNNENGTTYYYVALGI